ncbi:MAG: DUF2207 domain-containing protein [Tissierellales bacterium]
MKNFSRNIFLFLFIILMVFSFPTISNAEKSLTIPKWQIESRLLENGDLSIVEDITFRFNEKYNGVFREIVLNKTSGVQDIKVSEVTENGEFQYKKANSAKKGDYGVFTVTEDSDVSKLQIFSPSRDEEKTFRISYSVKNVAIKYKDTGELYYKFLGKENETSIGSFTVEIRLPQNDVNNEVKVFSHGPLNGKITRKTSNIVYMQVTDVQKNTFIEGRILFPKGFIPDSTNLINKNNYDNIIDEELALQKKIEEKSAFHKKITRILGNTSLIVSIVEVLIFILLLILFKREKKPYEILTNNAIPEDCTPAIAVYTTMSFIDSTTIMATILDLFRKGYIIIDDGEEHTEKRKKLKDFSITRVREDDNFLISHERYFLGWLLDEIGDGRTVSTKDIENYSKDQSTKFNNAYYNWQRKIKEDAINKGYYEKGREKYARSLVIFSSIALIFSIVTLIFESLLGLVLLATSLILLVFGIALFYRKSDYGYSQYIKWVEFKKHMNNSKKLDKIEDFSRYPLDISLIYALGLGVNKKVIKKFNIENTINSGETLYSNGWLYWYFIFDHDRNNLFRDSIDRSFSGISSSTGSGGGFTSGGGGGAGGGGAGGF